MNWAQMGDAFDEEAHIAFLSLNMIFFLLNNSQVHLPPIHHPSGPQVSIAV
jgi:hypothetical protein